jgi:hypothetical protein
MMIIVDGTGPYDDPEYRWAMNSSFCLQLNSQVAQSKYWRGPGWVPDGQTHSIAEEAYRFLCDFMKAKPSVDEPVYLAGYSRGGAAAIQIAKWLRVPQVHHRRQPK